MTETHASDAVGQVVLGRYRIVRRLARGGMGAVYLGRTEGARGFSRPVVIKRILPWLTQDSDIAQMFVREARILSNLRHPSIVSVLDFGQHPDGSYIMVLDYVHGYELAQWHVYAATVRHEVPVEHALYILCKVLDGLHYAHTLKRADGKALGIVHRDVTPTNVYLSDQGDIKLLDFGIALVVSEERKFTGESEVRGKLPYLPAEVCAGATPSVAGDVYSAGVMLYELLTGINPFDGRQPAEIFKKIMELEPPPVRDSRRDVPAELDTVLQRALTRDLDVRYATAAELAQALRALPRRSDDVIAAELAAQLQQDFADMPKLLGIDSLEVRERAWRGVTSVLPAALGPEESVEVGEGDTVSILPEAAHSHSLEAGAELAQTTLCVSVPDEVIHQAVRSSPPPPAAHAAPRAHAESPLSLSRVFWVAGGAGVFGALVVLFSWLLLARDEPVQERMVVISKESTAREVETVGTATGAELAEREGAAGGGDLGTGQATGDSVVAESPPVPVAEPPLTAAARGQLSVAAAPAASGESARAAREPAPPDAQRLSRAFARKQRSVQSCFTKHAAGVTDLPQVSIHFFVAASGDVEDARLNPDALAGEPLGRCLLAIARQTRFGPQQRSVSFHIPISAEKVQRPGL